MFANVKHIQLIALKLYINKIINKNNNINYMLQPIEMIYRYLQQMILNNLHQISKYKVQMEQTL